MSNNNKSLKQFFTIVAIALFSGAAGGLIIIWLMLTTGWLSWLGFLFPLSFNNLDNRPIIIEQPREVTLNVDIVVKNVMASNNQRLAKLFVKKKSITPSISSVYTNDDLVGLGVAVTSDGWFITVKEAMAKGQDNILVYLPATNDKKLHKIDKIIEDEHSPLAFFKVESLRDMQVVGFSDQTAWQIGQTLIWQLNEHTARLGGILSLRDGQDESFFHSSEISHHSLVVNFDTQERIIFGSPLYDLSGRLTALQDSNGQFFYINWSEILSQLLKAGTIARPYLGVRYLALSELIGWPQDSLPMVKNGAWLKSMKGMPAVRKNSPAEMAGLEEGEVIVAVENENIYHLKTLADLISEYQPNDEVRLRVLNKDGQEREVIVTLGEY